MRSLLVTGGTGTIGRALVEDALRRGFQRVCVYSRDEYKQALMRDELPDERLRWFVGDVRDRDRLRRALEGVDAVLHAAALKRVEAGEFNPGEFIKTNVIGTLNLIEAAHDASVQRVVGISTDKALNPSNTYGATKLLMERLLLAANNARGDAGPAYAVVRFGNVIGSRGSVTEKWRSVQGSVPVTDQRCTRYWLDLNDALSVVWDGLRMMPREPLVPTMLRAFLITDLAEALGREWHEVGLRDGEVLHERLTEARSSDMADRMSVEEIRTRLGL